MLKKSAMLEMGRVVIGGEGRVQRAIGVCSCCSRVFLASDWWRTNMTVCLVLMRGGKDVIGITMAARDGEPEVYREKHPEIFLKQKRRYRKKHPEVIRDHNRRYRQKNWEKLTEIKRKKYRKAHPEGVREHQKTAIRRVEEETPPEGVHTY